MRSTYRRRYRNRHRSLKRKTRRHRHKHRGGGTLPIPRGSIASMALNSKDEYSVPVLVRRELAEEQLLDE